MNDETRGGGLAYRALAVARPLGQLALLFMLVPLSNCRSAPEANAKDVRSLLTSSVKREVVFAPLPDDEQSQFGLPLQVDAYRIGPRDRVRISLDPRLPPALARRIDVLVMSDGQIYLPELGAVVLNGLTEIEAQDVLREQIQKLNDKADYVSVEVIEYQSKHFYVLGAATRAGVYPVDGTTTLMEAMIKAGADDVGADVSQATVIRDQRVLPIDLTAIMERGDMSRNTTMRDGDIINIPSLEDRKAYVLGAVARPAVVPFSGKDGLSLLEAIAASGGLARGAKEDEIRIFRGSWQEPECFRLSACELYVFGGDIKLQAGDRILVAQSGLSKFNEVLEALGPTLSIPATALGLAASINILKN